MKSWTFLLACNRSMAKFFLNITFFKLDYLLFESVLRPYKAHTTEHLVEAATPSNSKTKESLNKKGWTF